MKKFELNTGGIVGAMVGLGLFGAAWWLSQATPETQAESPRPLLFLVMLGALAGNKLAARRKQSPSVIEEDEVEEEVDFDWQTAVEKEQAA